MKVSSTTTRHHLANTALTLPWVEKGVSHPGQEAGQGRGKETVGFPFPLAEGFCLRPEGCGTGLKVVWGKAPWLSSGHPCIPLLKVP